MQVDHKQNAIFPRLFEYLLQVVELAVEPAVVLRQIAVGVGLAPGPGDLNPHQFNVPSMQRLEVVIGEFVRRHHPAQQRHGGDPLRIGDLIVAVHQREQRIHLQARQIELHLAGAVLQPQLESSLLRGGRDGAGEGDFAPVEGSFETGRMVPVLLTVGIPVVEHEFDSVPSVAGCGDIPRPRPDGETERLPAERHKIHRRVGAVQGTPGAGRNIDDNPVPGDFAELPRGPARSRQLELLKRNKFRAECRRGKQSRADAKEK